MEMSDSGEYGAQVSGQAGGSVDGDNVRAELDEIWNDLDEEDNFVPLVPAGDNEDNRADLLSSKKYLEFQAKIESYEEMIRLGGEKDPTLWDDICFYIHGMRNTVSDR